MAVAAVAAEPERAVEIRRHRFTVDDFMAMGEAGIFTTEDRVELIDGEVYDMSPFGPPHCWIVDRLTELIFARVGGRVHVRIQNPMRLGRHTEPLPDVTVSKRSDAYGTRHPESGDVLLAIEVADSSLRFDRDVKAPRYARDGIPQMWLVDVAAGAVEVYTEPGSDGYSKRETLGRGGVLKATRVPDLALAVDDIFGTQPRGTEPRGTEPRDTEPRGTQPDGAGLPANDPPGDDPGADEPDGDASSGA